MPLRYFRFQSVSELGYDLLYIEHCLHIHRDWDLNIHFRSFLPSLSTFKRCFSGMTLYNLCKDKIVSDKRGDLLKYIAARHFDVYRLPAHFVEIHALFTRVGITEWFDMVRYHVDADELCLLGGTTDANGIKAVIRHSDMQPNEILRNYGCYLSIAALDYLTDIIPKYDLLRAGVNFAFWKNECIILLQRKGFLSSVVASWIVDIRHRARLGRSQA